MSKILSKIPKDLPITDPLLFSFLMIIDAAKFQVHLRSKYQNVKNDLPMFEYAVNSMSVRYDINDQKKQTQIQNVICGYFRDKPTEENCTKIYVEFPEGESTEKDHKISWMQDFESWRLDCFDNVRQIVSALIYKGKGDREQGTKRKLRYLADIFQWSLEGDTVNFFYAINKSNEQLYGVGADFALVSPVYDCCGKVPLENIEEKYFEEIGFKLPKRP